MSSQTPDQLHWTVRPAYKSYSIKPVIGITIRNTRGGIRRRTLLRLAITLVDSNLSGINLKRQKVQGLKSVGFTGL